MMSVTVGRLSGFRVLIVVLLVGSGAVAQQGFILEPWRKAPAPATAPVSALRPVPGAGLGPVVLPASQRRQASLPVAPVVSKWSPPVVELLVDPWALGQVAAPVMPRRWVPSSVEIVDPWAHQAAAESPAMASRSAGAPHSTIF